MVSHVVLMVLAAAALETDAVPTADKVTSLPGWTGALPSEHYSGYLEVGKLSKSSGMLHYWLQMSEGDPTADPVVMWLNGGPGASGMIGMLTELGQLQTVPSPGERVEPPQGGVPRLYHNKYSWTKAATLFTIEQPKNVGFSYCTDPTACLNTDKSTGQDTYEAIVAFFKLFPKLASRPFYITGESYAGVYIPMIMEQIDLHEGVPNFVGAMIGNGCWGSDCFYGVTEAEIDYHTFLGQDFMSPKLSKQIELTCGQNWSVLTQPEGTCGDGDDYSAVVNTNTDSNTTANITTTAATTTTTSTDAGAKKSACLQALAEMCRQVGNNRFNVYNMYDTCFPDNGLSFSEIRRRLRRRSVGMTGTTQPADAFHTHPALYATGDATASRAPQAALSLSQLNDYECGSETLMSAWLRLEAVQKALHVVNHPSQHFNYDANCGDLRPLYAKLVPKYKMLIYSGNVDACVPTWGSEFWTGELGETYGVEKGWHPWTSNSADPGSSKDVLAGYAVTYKVNNFTFATVKGAGHEVPRYKPRFALTLLETFLAGKTP